MYISQRGLPIPENIYQDGTAGDMANCNSSNNNNNQNLRKYPPHFSNEQNLQQDGLPLHLLTADEKI